MANWRLWAELSKVRVFWWFFNIGLERRKEVCLVKIVIFFLVFLLKCKKKKAFRHEIVKRTILFYSSTVFGNLISVKLFDKDA